jgi:hypothetical protein
MFPSFVDGRTSAARRLRDLNQQIAHALGQRFEALDAVRRGRVRRVAALMARIERLEFDQASGACADDNLYLALLDRLDRTLDQLGLVDGGSGNDPSALRVSRKPERDFADSPERLATLRSEFIADFRKIEDAEKRRLSLETRKSTP